MKNKKKVTVNDKIEITVQIKVIENIKINEFIKIKVKLIKWNPHLTTIQDKFLQEREIIYKKFNHNIKVNNLTKILVKIVVIKEFNNMKINQKEIVQYQ